jgi:phage terminase large subunit GpA-like protein
MMIRPSGIEAWFEAARHGWEPEPLLQVSEWADEHRILSGKGSAEPGRWRTSRTPYLRTIMDVLSPLNPAQRIVLMKGAQIGATECGNNWIGYLIHRAPGPILFVEPSVEVAKRVSKQRIAPMIASTPALSGRVAASRTRDSGNTMFVKEFDGGLLIITGANSGAGLRSMPIRNLFMDEVDEYPGDVDGQGDPVSLAEKRTTTFARRKVFLVSTPTIKGFSRIEREFLASDQRRYFVPCPLCGNMDWIRWPNIRWEERSPDTARLHCEGCGSLIEERHKTQMLERGEWRGTAEGDGRTVGFHLSGLYSPLGWKSWRECVEEFLDAKEDVFRLRVWVNTVLGESWEERGDSVEPDHVLARAEHYAAEVPNGVGVLVAGVDVHGDRLEVAVHGFGAGEESWLIAWTQIHGDPGRDETWRELDRFLAQSFEHESRQKVRVRCVCVDSGGHHTEHVYRYCKLRANRRVFPVRGGSVPGVPLVTRPTMHNRYRVKLFTLGVDTAKDVIYSRLRIPSPGPGFMHLPDWVDLEYVHQLTAERCIRKYVKGKGATRQWVKVRERNEALDRNVYALAALHILGPLTVQSLRERAARLAVPAEREAERIAAKEKAHRDRPRRTGWMSRWRYPY